MCIKPPGATLAALAAPLLVVGTLTLSACDRKPADAPPLAPAAPAVPKPSAPMPAPHTQSAPADAASDAN